MLRFVLRAVRNAPGILWLLVLMTLLGNIAVVSVFSLAFNQGRNLKPAILLATEIDIGLLFLTLIILLLVEWLRSRRQVKR